MKWTKSKQEWNALERDAFLQEMRAIMAKHGVRLRPYSWDDGWVDCFAGPDWDANVGDLADE